MCLNIFESQSQGGLRSIDSDYMRLRILLSQGDCNTPRAGAELANSLRRHLQGSYDLFHELLSLRARDERPRIDFYFNAEEIDMPHDVLKWLKRRTPHNTCAECIYFSRAHRPLKLQIQI